MSEARDGACEALRALRGELHWLDRIYRWVVTVVAFGVYFLLCMVPALLFSKLVQEQFDGPVMLTGAVIGALAGLVAGLNAYNSFGREGGDTHGSARFAQPSEVRADLGGDAGLIVGRELNGRKLLRYDGPAHLLTIAPTRSGKGVGTIIPNLLIADRSVLCIDPKGENARVTARGRARSARSTSSIRSTCRVSPAARSTLWTGSIPTASMSPKTPRCSRKPWSMILRAKRAMLTGTRKPRR